MKNEADCCLVEQYDEQVYGFKLELFNAFRSIQLLHWDVSSLTNLEVNCSQVIFDTCLQICRLVHMPAPVIHKVDIKIPKTAIPLFDSNNLNCRSFWEQYELSIHSRAHKFSPEKLAYLRQALRDGPAKQVITELSWSWSKYSEVIKCLQNAIIGLAYYIKNACKNNCQCPSTKEREWQGVTVSLWHLQPASVDNENVVTCDVLHAQDTYLIDCM